MEAWAAQAQAFNGQGFGGQGFGGQGSGRAAGGGLFDGLSRLLPAGRSEQFLLGAALGAAAAYVLSDDELRGKLIKSGLSLYSGIVGGLEEMKEQVADIQAEMAAAPDGPA
ncbi:hypothetical protein [Azospirillum doebereinerae]